MIILVPVKLTTQLENDQKCILFLFVRNLVVKLH